MTPIQFAKMNPLLSAGIVAVLLFGGWYFFNTLYAAGQIAILNHANKQLEKQAAESQAQAKQLTEEKQVLQDDLNEKKGQINQLEKDNEQKNALLQAASKQVVASKQNLDNATADASRIMGDTSPLTREQLKDKLCALYPTSKGCQ